MITGLADLVTDHAFSIGVVIVGAYAFFRLLSWRK